MPFLHPPLSPPHLPYCPLCALLTPHSQQHMLRLPVCVTEFLLLGRSFPGETGDGQGEAAEHAVVRSIFDDTPAATR